MEPRRVEVAWVDHAFAYGPVRSDDQLVVVKSVGYLVEHTEEVLVLAQSMGEEGPAECLYLIAGCVLSITTLRSDP